MTSIFALLTLLVSLLLSMPLVADENDAGNDAGITTKKPLYPGWFKDSFLDIADDVEDASSKNKRVILYFYEPDCGACKAFLRDKLARPLITQTIKKNFDVVPINMWGDNIVVDMDGGVVSERDFSFSRQGRIIPTLVFLNEKGVNIARIFGSSSISRFMAALHYSTERLDSSISFFDYIDKLKEEEDEAFSS
ncbi:MAG: thioredoxin fold domain-containing protein [Ectothiorhodospiraceae bacterium]|nr:thioredoxin fold domain-containing protein [Ectothiorhodospiraceae bacterium]